MYFYISMMCDECGEDILLGPSLSLIEKNGTPVIPFDIAAQETFECDCGAIHITGDFDFFTEHNDGEDHE